MKFFLPSKIVWSTVAQLLGKASQIVLGAYALHLVTSALGAEDYGFYGKIAEFSLFFSTAANLGIFGNTVRKMSEHPKDGKLFINALILRMFTASAFFTVGALCALFWIPSSTFLVGSIFFMASLFLDYITSVCDGMLQANYMMGRANAALVAGRISNVVMIMILLSHGLSSVALLFLAPLTAAAVTAFLSLLFVRQQIKFIWKLDQGLLKMLFLTSLPFGIINILNNIYFRFLPSFLMAKVLSEASYGSYTLSLHLASAASLFSTFLMFSALPELRQAIEHKHKQEVKRLLNTMKWGLLSVSIVMVLGGTFVAPSLIEWISGHSFIVAEYWFMLPLLLVLAAISYFYDVALITLFAFEQDLWFLKREGLTLCLGGSLLFASLLLPTTALQVLAILCSALAAEGFITFLGLRKLSSM